MLVWHAEGPRSEPSTTKIRSASTLCNPTLQRGSEDQLLKANVFIFCCCDKGHSQKQFGGGDGLFGLQVVIPAHHRGKSEQVLQGKRPRARAEAKALECSLPVCSWWLAYILLQLSTSCLGMAPPTLCWSLPPTSVIKKTSYQLAYRQSDGDTVSIAVTLPL